LSSANEKIGSVLTVKVIKGAMNSIILEIGWNTDENGITEYVISNGVTLGITLLTSNGRERQLQKQSC